MFSFFESIQHIPFKYNGRGIDGLDCYGFVRLCYKKIKGIDLPDFSWVDAQDFKNVARTFIDESAKPNWERISHAERSPLDVILMTRIAKGARLPVHVGLLADNYTVAHFEENAGLLFEGVESQYISNRIVSIFKYVGGSA